MKIDIFGKKTRRRIHGIKKSQNLDQDSPRNHQVNEIEISEFKNHEKLTLK